MSSQIKLVYMVPGCLSNHWERIFCLDALCRHFDLEYWDCEWDGISPSTSKQPLIRSYIRIIPTLDCLKYNLALLPKDALVVSDFDFETRNYSLYKLIHKYVKNIIEIDVYSYSIFLLSNPAFTTSLKRGNTFSLVVGKKVLYNFFVIRAILKKIKHGHNYDVLDDLRSSLRLRKENRLTRYHYACKNLFYYTKINTAPLSQYYINHPDYEKFLSIRYANRLIESNYIVYIDQYYPKHPDIIRNNPSLDIANISDAFYKTINPFFDKLEKYYNCEVIIAAHPKAQYISENPFGNRRIIYFKTAELIQYASGVCMHYSNSFSFVALFDKPFTLLDCRAFQQCESFELLNYRFAKLLRKQLIKIDEENDISDIFSKCNREIRDKYLSNLADINETRRNPELYKENFLRIHDDIVKKMYDKNQ